MKQSLLQIGEPEDYLSGCGFGTPPMPMNIVFFVRRSKIRLQQGSFRDRSHHRFVLIFNLKTKGNVHLDNLVLPLRAGQALVIHPFQFHHFSHLDAIDIKWIFCTFELKSDKFLEPLRNRVIDIDDKTRQALETLLTEWHAPRTELQAQQLQTCLLRLLLSLQQNYRQTASDLPPEAQDNLLRTVNRLLSEWRGRTVVVADLADAIGYSESRLRILFKEAAGMPLGSYIQHYKLNRAMALLRTSELPIADVAEEVGFGSQQAFSYTFKKKTGHTPRAYRNQQ